MNEEGSPGSMNFTEVLESEVQISWVFKQKVIQFIYPKKNILLVDQCELFKFGILIIDIIESTVKFYQIKLSQ